METDVKKSFCVWIASVLVASSPAWGASRSDGAWTNVAEGATGRRQGAVLVPVGGRMLLLGGSVKGAPYVQAFDPATKEWGEVTGAAPKARRGIHPYYQTAYDPKTKTVYCFHAGQLHAFSLKTKTWTDRGRPEALGGLSWHSVALDPGARKLVVVGSDKRPGNVGWTRTAVLELGSGKWSTLPLPDGKVVAKHRQIVAASQALIELTGRMRLAWYRDPAGVGTDDELAALSKRCADVKVLPAMADYVDGLSKVAALLNEKKTLDALKAARTLQEQLGVDIAMQYPVPPSRRNAPLVFDAKNKVFVLFGGDHEDYLMNDTWVLDLAKGWRRAAPKTAPSPRAGHQLVYLPKCGKIAMYEGYVQSSSSDYRSAISHPINPRQLWLFDVKANRWERVGAWTAKRRDPSLPATAGFYGYAGQYFAAPAMAATDRDEIVLVAGGATWMLRVPGGASDAVAGKYATKPNQRLYRTGRFRAAYCEVAAKPKTIDLERLPANRWVKMPPAPRNVMHGCRKRDWGTAVWDPKHEQMVRWGGGHCVRSASTPVHYSFVSNRMVEGYDADEPYGYNGGGGFGSSLLNRPWCPTHGYNLYAYDPPSGLIVTATGFLYDPARMDWLRTAPMQRPFRFSWGHTVLEHSPHGAVAWATSHKGGIGLFVYRHGEGWKDLGLKGKLFSPYCDSDGMCYDAKRDRMLIGWGGGYQKKGDGTLRAFDFKTRAITVLKPGNLDLGKIQNTREMVYATHTDLVLFGSKPVKRGKKTATLAYDCAADAYRLLDAGEAIYGHGAAWQYDARRKLVLVTDHRGAACVLRLEPKTATWLEDKE
jgi:hypothetical protein